MTARDGTLKGDELWMRCPYCGDSEHDQSKAHFSVNLMKGVYSCHRCGASGRLSTRDWLLYTSYFQDEAGARQQTISQEILDIPQTQPGPGTDRYSLLRRNHLDFRGMTWDAFSMRDIRDAGQVGLHLRRPNSSFNFGERGFGWVGERAPTSSPQRPLRIVEGPYDVLEVNDVCVFGSITDQTLLDLRTHFLILTPDGDVWLDKKKRFKFLKLLVDPRILISDAIMGIEYLPDGLDPDEVLPEERGFIPRGDFSQVFSLAIKDRRERFSMYLSHL